MGAGRWIDGIIGFMTDGPLGALAGYALGSLIDLGSNPANSATAYGNGHTKENVFAGQQNSFFFSMSVMTSYIIRTNGRIMYSEMEYVRNFLRTNFGVTVVGEGERILLNLSGQRKRMNMQNPFTFKNTIRNCGIQVAVDLIYRKRLQLPGFLASIARSDNNVCREEVETLREVAAYMGLSEKEVRSTPNLGGSSLGAAHRVLEIDPTATDEEVRATYRKLVLEHHPDRVATLGENTKRAAEKKLQNINNAKKVIYRAREIK